ncbi:glutathione S-transferase F8, chloroplastic [Morus notabilis]|uniref:glutathione S-transferase F8, chloroplastic n=1 Tax=Morus notabilis TaxID=981085 RepID=UPI000CECE87F|nr:glutathione S-transferase F8, chloroplastic [Morus notabilis]
MAAIKVHGSPLSTATQRALATLYEKDLDFEFVTVDLSTGAHKQEPYISKNPFGQVPAVEIGDLKLFESRAITKFIAEEYADKGTQLVHSEKEKKAALYVWLEVEAHQFEPVASKLVWELVFKPLFKIPTDPAAVEENEAKLGKVLDVYENRLSKAKYLAGDSFTLADLHHLPNTTLLLGTSSKVVFESRPHVQAWAADITARPAWSKVLALRG